MYRLCSGSLVRVTYVGFKMDGLHIHFLEDRDA